MPTATDFGGFGAIGVPAFLSPVTGNSQAWPGLTGINTNLRKPISWNFTQIGTAFTSVTDRLDRLVVVSPTNTLKLTGLVQPVPGTPYTFETAVGFSGFPSTTDSQLAGLILYDGTKALAFMYGLSTTANKLLIWDWATLSSNNAPTLNVAFTLPQEKFFLRLTDDGTNRFYYVSANGKDYAQIATDATNTFLTPTQIGLAIYTGALTAGSTAPIYWFYHYLVTAGTSANSLP